MVHNISNRHNPSAQPKWWLQLDWLCTAVTGISDSELPSVYRLHCLKVVSISAKSLLKSSEYTMWSSLQQTTLPTLKCMFSFRPHWRVYTQMSVCLSSVRTRKSLGRLFDTLSWRGLLKFIVKFQTLLKSKESNEGFTWTLPCLSAHSSKVTRPWLTKYL